MKGTTTTQTAQMDRDHGEHDLVSKCMLADAIHPRLEVRGRCSAMQRRSQRCVWQPDLHLMWRLQDAIPAAEALPKTVSKQTDGIALRCHAPRELKEATSVAWTRSQSGRREAKKGSAAKYASFIGHLPVRSNGEPEARVGTVRRFHP